MYDPATGFLLTGDTVYPGRLYVSTCPRSPTAWSGWPTSPSAHAVTHVLGCHIEMTSDAGPGLPARCLYQPDEPPLQMTVAQLVAVRDAAHAVADRPGAHRIR